MRIRCFACLVVFLMILVSCRQDVNRLSLAGEWNFALDPQDVGLQEKWQEKILDETVQLPGSLQEQGKGEDVSVTTRWTGQIVDSAWYYAPEYEPYRQDGQVKVPFWLTPDKHYVGVAWYQKKINVPSEWEGRSIELNLERAHWETMLFVDGRQAGECTSLAVPHRYILDGLSAGEHILTLRVDNRMKVDVGMNAHSVSDHTQTNWNGVIGDLSLRVHPTLYIDHVRLDPDAGQKKVLVRVCLAGKTDSADGELLLQVENSDGTPVGKAVHLTAEKGNQELKAEVDLEDQVRLWSAETPDLYRMRVTLNTPQGADEQIVSFGFRDFRAQGTRFEINGRPVFLRGTLECCVFPLTGYPAMDKDYWKKIYGKCKEYGLNHVRFHSWCPPEAAFSVADSMGLYLQVECGAWAEVGSGLPQDEWIRQEGDRILKEYGNHPSFCLMAYGNEPSGNRQADYLGKLVNYWKQTDGRRVYTSAAGWPYVPEADFWSTMEPRIQVWGAGLNSVINREAPRTDYDWREIIRKDMPTVSHEIGQWCVYPRLKEREKYTGVLKAGNFDIFKASLRKNGMEHLADSFLYASGRLQTLCYKMDIEASLRTPGMAGFQLLGLNDFPGQGTALVGVLDPFWEEKGYVDGKEFSSFCSQTVPLIRFPKMVWTNKETLKAPLEIAHFGTEPIQQAELEWKVATADGKLLKQESLSVSVPLGNAVQIGEISLDLSEIKEASKLVVSAGIKGFGGCNSWNVFVYPVEERNENSEIYITEKLDSRACEELSRGKSVLWLSYDALQSVKDEVAVGFSSIFWNTAWTRGQAPHTLGVYCRADHPALASFPNDGVSDVQWWELVSRCRAMNMNAFPKDFYPVVHLIDDWFTARKLGVLFEARVGGGKLMVCSADLQHDLPSRPAAAQFRRSLMDYMASERFQPSRELDLKVVESIMNNQK